MPGDAGRPSRTLDPTSCASACPWSLGEPRASLAMATRDQDAVNLCVFVFFSPENGLETTHDGSMVLLYMVTWIPSIYPSHVSIYTSTMDPSWVIVFFGVDSKNFRSFPLWFHHVLWFSAWNHMGRGLINGCYTTTWWFTPGIVPVK